MLPKPWKQPQLYAPPPKNGSRPRVIGAGLARTGTNSFCAAVSHLLDGPAYHVGVQTVVTGDPSHVRKWTYVLKHHPYDDPKSREKALALLKGELDGYVMVTDPPVPQLVPELMELYPDALVIVTMRDKKSWMVSMANIIKLIDYNTLQLIFFWLRGLREVPSLWRLFGVMQVRRYGSELKPTLESMEDAWDRHMDWLREVVPKEKLFYYDVRDGWAPLCKILDKPVPKDMPFPRLNDSESLEAAFKSWSIQGLSMWLVAVSIVVAIVSLVIHLLR